MKALLKNYHQSPRKVRLVADLIRGKSVAQAKAALAFLPKKSAPDITKLLNSAIANARESGASPESLFVEKITIDKGGVMRRYRPFARGRAGSIQKVLSIVSLELGTRERTENPPSRKAMAGHSRKQKTDKKKSAQKSPASEAVKK